MYGWARARAAGNRGDVPKTQQERKAETRARLLDAAADLFAAQGVDAVSVDAVAEAAGRTSGSVYAHFGSKQGLLLALLDAWKDSVRTVLLAEVAVTESPQGQLAAVWGNLAGLPDERSVRWALLEHELWLRSVRDPEVAEVMRDRNAEARAFSARQLAGWSSRVGARPAAEPEGLAVLVTALLAGLAMQRRLEPDVVSDDLAVRGLCALVGLETDERRPPTADERP
jgi:AcrR family transcriptional regulator